MLIDNEWDFKCADISKEFIQGRSVMFFIGTFMEVPSKSRSKETSGTISSTSQIPQPRNIWPWIIIYYSSSVKALWKEFKKHYRTWSVSETLNYNILRDWLSTVGLCMYFVQQTEHEWYKAQPRKLSIMTMQELMTFFVWFHVHKSAMTLQLMVVIGTRSSFYPEYLIQKSLYEVMWPKWSYQEKLSSKYYFYRELWEKGHIVIFLHYGTVSIITDSKSLEWLLFMI